MGRSWSTERGRGKVSFLVLASVLCLLGCEKRVSDSPKKLPEAPSGSRDEVPDGVAPPAQEGARQHEEPAGVKGDEGEPPVEKQGATTEAQVTGAAPAAQATGAAPAARTFPPLGAQQKEARSCSADNECVVSCDLDGRCCDELCGCSQVYNKSFAARLAHAKKQSCSEDVMCPVPRCVGTKGGKAVCKEGSCELARPDVPDASPVP